jgi:hypothetical protein
MMFFAKRRTRITRDDWVGLRALYILLASDASAAVLPEVQRILKYYQDKYEYGAVTTAMGQLARDNAVRITFDNPASAISRRLDSSIVITQKNQDFSDSVEEITLDGRAKKEKSEEAQRHAE